MDLTDLDTVKAWLGLPSAPGAGDALITQLIGAVSAFIEDYLGRALASTAYVETYDGTGASSILLRQYPITAVQSVTFRGRTISILADPASGRNGLTFNGRRLTLVGDRFPKDAPVVVSYTAGYATPPPAVAQAAVEIVGEAFRRRDRIGQSSKSLGGQETVSFQTGDMNVTAKAMLSSYQSVVPV